MEINIENAHLVLKKYLEEKNQKKYEHSIRVAKISEILAQTWGVDVSKAVIAGLLHDIGKSMSKQEMLSLCVRHNITIYDFELWENVTALHGRISSLLFEEEFEGNDEKTIKEISHAISSHIAGDENMSLLDKVTFIADNLDLKEGSKDLLKKIEKGEVGPNDCVRQIIKQKIAKNQKKGWEHNPLLNATLMDMDDER